MIRCKYYTIDFNRQYRYEHCEFRIYCNFFVSILNIMLIGFCHVHIALILYF